MDYQVLHTELTTDPFTLGYAGETDQQAADTLNSLTTGRTRNRTSVPPNEVLGAIVPGDLNALTTNPPGYGNHGIVTGTTRSDPVPMTKFWMPGLWAVQWQATTTTVSGSGTIAATATFTGAGIQEALGSGTIGAAATFTGAGIAEVLGSGTITAFATFRGHAGGTESPTRLAFPQGQRRNLKNYGQLAI